ncbi:5946_t:CDS:2, partial [Gigaspora margarita]
FSQIIVLNEVTKCEPIIFVCIIMAEKPDLKPTLVSTTYVSITKSRLQKDAYFEVKLEDQIMKLLDEDDYQ